MIEELRKKFQELVDRKNSIIVEYNAIETQKQNMANELLKTQGAIEELDKLIVEQIKKGKKDEKVSDNNSDAGIVSDTVPSESV